MRRVEGLAIVSIAWLMIAWFAGLPYMWNGLGQIDALFEAMSGLTTTGATVFRDFSVYGGACSSGGPDQWLGGMGVIALFVAILPRLAIGGREMFFAEASGPDEEKVAPQIRRTALLLWQLYAALTVAADHRPDADRHAVVRRGLQHVRDHFGGGILTTPALDRRLPEPGRRVGDDRRSCSWPAPTSRCNTARCAQRDFRVFTDDEELRAYAGVVALATLVAGVLHPRLRERG